MTDHDFAIIRGAILQKSRRTCQVSVSFDTDDMEGFRIKRQVIDSIAVSGFDANTHQGIFSYPRVSKLVKPQRTQGRNFCMAHEYVNRHSFRSMELLFILNPITTF